MHTDLITVDVGSVLGTRDDAMVRFSLTGAARNGTAHTSSQHGYLYLTRSATDATLTRATRPRWLRHTRRNAAPEAGARSRPASHSDAGGPPATPAVSFYEGCVTTPSDDGSTPTVEFLFSVPLTVEAIDPEAEARLTGLDRAITAGRALTEMDSAVVTGTWPDTNQPAAYGVKAVMASQLPFDYQATMTVEELAQSTINEVMATKDAATRRRLVVECHSSADGRNRHARRGHRHTESAVGPVRSRPA